MSVVQTILVLVVEWKCDLFSILFGLESRLFLDYFFVWFSFAFMGDGLTKLFTTMDREMCHYKFDKCLGTRMCV